MSVAVEAPPQGPTPRRKSSRGRVLVRSVGELMITLGAIMLLLVVYQLYWTNIEANRVQGTEKQDLRQAWDTGQRIKGGAIGIMYIQRLGKTWEKPLVEGVGLDSLRKGIGHFPDNAMPGQVGNFAVAGHRATNGEPFAYLDRIRPQDKVVVETRDRWYVYTIAKMPGAAPANPAWKLVDPSYVDVLLPVPEQAGVSPTKKTITLVTCNPRWGSTTRLIIYGTLTKTYNKPGVLPPELAYTKKKA